MSLSRVQECASIDIQRVCIQVRAKNVHTYTNEQTFTYLHTLQQYVQIQRWVGIYYACMHTSMSQHLHTAYVNM